MKSNSDIPLSNAESPELPAERTVVSDFKQMKLEQDAQKNWDLFYKRNTTNFFKDRHWTTREFGELQACREVLMNDAFESQRLVLLEAGCGVGNSIFPLLEDDRNIFIYACDFSPRAVDFVKAEEKSETPRRKPLVLIWVPPLGVTFDFNDCKKYYDITSCDLTYDRALYQQAAAVLFFHKNINSLGNMPQGQRPPLQKWIWHHIESPSNTWKIAGIDNIFNLTLNYRRDADISVRYNVVIKDEPGDDFVLPKKDKLGLLDCQ
ncbi:hypothetical protein CRUP_018255 [Coryphaenoides rupestris]|nr:hypothetical protein CRUP_018255 [Coryphaenoides rupestris]